MVERMAAGGQHVCDKEEGQHLIFLACDNHHRDIDAKDHGAGKEDVLVPEKVVAQAAGEPVLHRVDSRLRHDDGHQQGEEADPAPEACRVEVVGEDRPRRGIWVA